MPKNTVFSLPLMQSVIKFFVSIVLLFIFLAGAMFILFTFGRTSYDTTMFTNAGFAIFAGCSSVAFAWCRSLKEIGDHRDLNRINHHGEKLFLSALCFIMASLCKYLLIHRNDFISESLVEYFTAVFKVVNVVGALLFLVAYLMAWGGILGLLRILFRKRLDKPGAPTIW